MLSPPPLPPITLLPLSATPQFTSIIASAFTHDALNRAAMLYAGYIPSSSGVFSAEQNEFSAGKTVFSTEQRQSYFLPGIERRAKAGGLLVESMVWGGVALWIPPDIEKTAPDPSTLSSFMIEYFEKTVAVKKAYLGERRYWYLNLIGRDPERKDSGVVRALFEPYLKAAEEAGLPVWLEATNTHARDVYIRFGFKVVAELVIGKGDVSEDGNLLAGGKGVKVYSMVKEPS